MVEHRVSVLSASLRRYEDPALSADPQIRALLAQLATLELAPPPRAHFRAELRAQLVAVAPRLIAEGVSVEARRPVAAHIAAVPETTEPAASSLRRSLGRRRKISLGRPLALLASVAMVFAVLLGGAVWMSKKALPGDTLYSLKRANENVTLSLAGGDTEKGRDYLRFANTRIIEVSELLSRSSAAADGAGPSASGGVNAHTAQLITATLDSADSDVRNASQLLATRAARDDTAEPLTIITTWAPDQIGALQGIAERLGPGDLRDRTTASTHLAATALTRAQNLQAALGCNCLTKVPTDDLGPVPCTMCSTDPAPARQTPAVAPSTTTGGLPAVPPVTGSLGAGTGGAVTAPAGDGAPGTKGGSAAPNLPVPPLPTAQLPTAPLPTAPLPTLPGPPPGHTGLPSSGAAVNSSCHVSLFGICLGL